MRNVSHGEARGNVVEGNCIGMLLLAGAPGPQTDWQIRDNRVRDNNKACAAEEDGAPELSGAGIVMVGAQDFRLTDNRVTGHDSDAPSAVKGGIVAISTTFVPGLAPFDPSGVVADNRLRNNTPDLFSDGTGNVRFDDNRCRTSDPAGLCD
jgi:nitrous oxidase accessory protein NosD